MSWKRHPIFTPLDLVSGEEVGKFARASQWGHTVTTFLVGGILLSELCLQEKTPRPQFPHMSNTRTQGAVLPQLVAGVRALYSTSPYRKYLRFENSNWTQGGNAKNSVPIKFRMTPTGGGPDPLEGPCGLCKDLNQHECHASNNQGCLHKH